MPLSVRICYRAVCAVYIAENGVALFDAEVVIAPAADALDADGHAVVGQAFDGDILLDFGARGAADFQRVGAVVAAGDDRRSVVEVPAAGAAGLKVAVSDVAVEARGGKLRQRYVVVKEYGGGVFDHHIELDDRVRSAVELPYMLYPIRSGMVEPLLRSVYRGEGTVVGVFGVKIMRAGTRFAFHPAGEAVVRVRFDGDVLRNVLPLLAGETEGVVAAVTASRDDSRRALEGPGVAVARLEVAVVDVAVEARGEQLLDGDVVIKEDGVGIFDRDRYID